MHRSLVPSPWQGICSNIVDDEYAWLKEFGCKSYAALYQDWTSTQKDLPIGFDLYVVTFHVESVNLNWIKKQSDRLKVPIVVLSDGQWYDCKIKGATFYSYFYWHRQIDRLLEWYPNPNTATKRITKKASGICYRLNLNKALVVMSLLTSLGPDDSIVSFGDWIDEDLLAYQDTGWPKIDNTIKYFRDHHQGTRLELELPQKQLLNSLDTYYQDIASDYHIPAYENCALNFTNESFTHSLMHHPQGNYIHPGPLLTEKTFKCLVSATAFIPTGQFETYRTLEKLGLKFDYGLDISWDLDSGNLSRMTSVIDLIESLKNIDAQDIYLRTLTSTQHNQEMMFGEIQKRCRSMNDLTKQSVLADFLS